MLAKFDKDTRKMEIEFQNNDEVDAFYKLFNVGTIARFMRTNDLNTSPIWMSIVLSNYNHPSDSFADELEHLYESGPMNGGVEFDKEDETTLLRLERDIANQQIQELLTQLEGG